MSQGRLLLTLLWAAGSILAQPTLTHGPIVGDPETTVASIWFRASGPALASVVHASNPAFAGSVETSAMLVDAASNFSGRIDLSGLSAQATIWYRVRLRDPSSPSSSSVSLPARFQTAPLSTTPADLVVAVIADVGNLAEYDLFGAVAGHQPDVSLFLGDWPYADSSPAATTQAAYRQKHLDARAHPTLQSLFASSAIAPIFDDHEILNDWDAGADPARVLLGRSAWLEAMPVRSVQGRVYRNLRFGSAAEFFILDTRTYRGENSAPDVAGRSFLGAPQWAWLQSALASSTATFKFIVTSVPLRYGTTNKDHWQGYMRERQALFSWLQTQRISNVVFLSGDQHWSAVHHHREGFLEFQACPLAAGLRAPPAEPELAAGPIFPERSFGILRIRGQAAPDEVDIEFHGVGGLLHQRKIVSGLPAQGLVAMSDGDASYALDGPARFQNDGPVSLLARLPAGDYTLAWKPNSPATMPPDPLFLAVPDDGFFSAAADFGSAAVPALLFAADFATPDLSLWTVVDEGTTDAPSAWFVDDDRLVQSSNIFGGSTAAAALERPGTDILCGDANWTNVAMHFRVRSDDDDGVGAVIRYASNGSCYRFLMDEQRQQMRILRRQNGVTTLLAEAVGTYGKARWYDVTFEAIGSSLRVAINGATVLTATDSALTSGRVGLTSWGSQVVWFDRVRVYAARPAAGPTGALLHEDWSDGSLAGWAATDQGSVAAPSAWSVVDQRLIQTSNIYGGTLAGADPEKPGTFLLRTGATFADFTMGVRLRSDDNDAIGVMFRVVDGANYYRFSMDSERSYRRLSLVQNGVTTVLAETSDGYLPGKWMDLHLRAEGPLLVVSLDGIPVLTASHSAFSAGGVGLYCWGSSAAAFDDVAVLPLGPPSTVISAVGTADSFQISISASGYGGKAYQLACALALAPGIPLAIFDPADVRVIPLAIDPLLLFSLQNLPPFMGMRGVLDSDGYAFASVQLPPGSAPSGLSFFASGLVLDATAQSGIAAVLPSLPITLP